MTRTPLRHILPVSVLALAALTALALPAKPAFAFPPAGTDALDVSGTVSVTSRLGSETIDLTGTAEIARSDPYLDGGVSVVDLEIVSLDLTGSSLTGSVAASESATLVSLGEIRSQQPSADFPADLYLDAFVVISAPASPQPAITLHNNTALHLTPSFGGTPFPISSWPPPPSPPLVADTTPCVPLLPTDPMAACLTDVSVAFGQEPGPGGGVGGFTELAPPVASASERALRFPIAVGVALAGFLAIAISSWWRARRTKS